MKATNDQVLAWLKNEKSNIEAEVVNARTRLAVELRRSAERLADIADRIDQDPDRYVDLNLVSNNTAWVTDVLASLKMAEAKLEALRALSDLE